MKIQNDGKPAEPQKPLGLSNFAFRFSSFGAL